MTWYIIFGLVIGLVLYRYYSNRNKNVYMQSTSDQNVNDHHQHSGSSNYSGHEHKKGHGCC